MDNDNLAIPTWAIDSGGPFYSLTRLQSLVYLNLLANWDDRFDGTAEISLEGLAAKVHATKSSVSKAIGVLIRNGMISRTREARRGRPAVYRVEPEAPKQRTDG